MDNKLSWKQHVAAVSQKVYSALNRLYKFRHGTPLETRIRLVNSLIVPHIDFCDIVYCDANGEIEYKLEKLLNSCIRYVYNLRKFDHISKFYNLISWLRISERREFHVLCFVYKILRTYQPSYLKEMFTLMSSVHSRNTRSHEYYLQIPKCKVESFASIGARLWNKLTKDQCCKSTYQSFKSCLQKIML
jgi:hypothetical protein